MRAIPAIADSADAAEPPVQRAVPLQRLGAGLAIVAVAEALGVLLISTAGDQRFLVGLNLPSIGFITSIVMFPTVGALIIQRRPPTRVAWLMILIGLTFGVSLLLYGYGTIGMPPAGTLPGARELLVLAQLFFVPVPAPGVAFLLLLFPTDRLLGNRWKSVIAIGLIGAVLYSIGTTFRPGQIDTTNFPTIENPFGAPASWSGFLDLLSLVGNTMVTGSIALGAVSLAIRYRRAGVVESAQIRWIALVAALAAVALAIAALQVEGGAAGDVSEIAFGVGLVLLALMPIAIGIAITRYRLYDIDRLINRALVYGSLTAILAGVFTAAIGLAQRLFVATTGQTSDAAIVLTTLVVATFYAPLRKRLESLIDRRFKYDERRFGEYRAEIRRVLSVLEPGRAAQRLVSEAVAELAATGGAVVDVDGRPTASAGAWPVAHAVRIPIPGRSGALAALVIGPRIDGTPHDPRSVVELEEVVGLVAAGIRLHGQGSGLHGQGTGLRG